jgi:hypothetical protein
MDEHTSPAPIRVTDINPLLQGGPSGADTMNHVKAVLSTLSCLSTVDDVAPEGFDFGLSLIHQWLETTLNFTLKYPDVQYVLPATRSDQAGGAS